MPSTEEDAALQKCGYNGRVSPESHFSEDFVDAITLPILKNGMKGTVL